MPNILIDKDWTVLNSDVVALDTHYKYNDNVYHVEANPDGSYFLRHRTLWNCFSDDERAQFADAVPSTVKYGGDLTPTWCDTDDRHDTVLLDCFDGKHGLYSKDLVSQWPTKIDDAIHLGDGSFLFRKYGKYDANLCFLTKKPLLTFTKVNAADFNLPTVGNYSAVYGSYFVSKKGTKCFRVSDKENATAVLLKDGWGGSFNKYRGGSLPDNNLYYVRKHSNGGRAGCDYAVVPVGYKFTLSVDDI